MKDKVVLVTGITGSIGQAVCEKFLDEGCRIIGLARSKDKLEQIKQIAPGKIDIYSVDLTREKEIHEFFKILTTNYARIDVLVNCAGGGPFGGVMDIGRDIWIQTVNLKLLGYIEVAKQCLSLLRKSESGRIINIIGTFGKQPSPFFAVGSVVNAGLLAFTKEFSEEIIDSGVTVNAVNPGAVDSALWDETIKVIQKYGGREARFLTSDQITLVLPKEVANAVCFLSKESSSSINGSAIYVDKGAYSGF